MRQATNYQLDHYQCMVSLPISLAHSTEIQTPLTPAALCCIRAGPPAHDVDADSQIIDGPYGARVLRPQHPLPLLQRLAEQRFRLRVPAARQEGGEGVRRAKNKVNGGRV